MSDPAYWVFIERSVAPYSHHDKDVYIGPFDNEPDAELCMNESFLVDGMLQREWGGGTDCFVTTDQPDPEQDETWIVDKDDPRQTGKDGEPPEPAAVFSIMYEGELA